MMKRGRRRGCKGGEAGEMTFEFWELGEENDFYVDVQGVQWSIYSQTEVGIDKNKEAYK